MFYSNRLKFVFVLLIFGQECACRTNIFYVCSTLLYVGKCSNFEVGMCSTLKTKVGFWSTQYFCKVSVCSTLKHKFVSVLLIRLKVGISSTHFLLDIKCSTTDVL